MGRTGGAQEEQMAQRVMGQIEKSLVRGEAYGLGL